MHLTRKNTQERQKIIFENRTKSMIYYLISYERKGDALMHEYEVLVETINPCGGSKHSKKEFIEVQTDSPENYVKTNGRFPIMEILEAANGDVTFVTGDGSGNFVKYTFSE